MDEHERRELEARLAVALEGFGWWTCIRIDDRLAAFCLDRDDGKIAGFYREAGWSSGRDPKAILPEDWDEKVPRYTESLDLAMRLCAVLMSRWDEEARAIGKVETESTLALWVEAKKTKARLYSPIVTREDWRTHYLTHVPDCEAATPALALCMALDAAVKEEEEAA